MSQPGVIDGLQFARTEGVLEGSVDLSQLPRLAESNCATEGLRFGLRGSMNAEGRPQLGVTVRGNLRMVCQRCLGPMDFPVEINVDLVLSDSLAEIESVDDGLVRVLAGKAMPVSELIEDEVLLVMPMVPRHDQCEGAGSNAAQRESSPFAVLARLKQG